MSAGIRPSTRLVIAHAMLAAVVFSMHHTVALWINRGDYTPFGMSADVSAIVFDETHYAAPVEHLAATHRMAAEVDAYEHRGLHANIPFVPAGILAGLAVASGSVARAFIIADVVFPALLLVIFYTLSGGWVERPFLRLLIAWSTLTIPFDTRDFTWLGYEARVMPPGLTRTPQPEISIVFLVISVMLFAWVLSTPFRWRRAFGAGMLACAVVYCYYFYAVAWCATVALAFALGLAWRNRQVMRSAFAVGAGTALAAAPYLAIWLWAHREGGQAFLMSRVGTFTRQIYAVPLASGLICLGILIVFGRRASTKNASHMRSLVMSIMVVAGLLATNLHVITGYNAQHRHFVYRLSNQFTFFLLAVALARVLERGLRNRPALLRTATACGFVLLLGVVAGRQFVVAAHIAPYQRESSPEMELIAWIRSHLPPNQVVATTSPVLIGTIPALAPEYSYVPAGTRSLTSTAEIKERYFQLADATGVSEADMLREVRRTARLSSSELLLILTLPADSGTELVGEYRAFRASHAPVLTYRIDYLVWPAAQRIPDPIGAGYPKWRQVYQNQGYQVLQLH